MLRKMLIGAAVLVALAAAPAAAQYNISVGPANVNPGGTVTVSGDSCGAFDEVTVTFERVGEGPSTRAGDIQGVVVATGTANESGEYNLTFTVPADAQPGRYQVTVYCAGVEVAHAFINVVGPTSGPGGKGSIVKTGSDLNGLAILGAGLLVSGGIILIATKGRRHRATA